MSRNEVLHRRTSERICRLPKHCAISPKFFVVCTSRPGASDLAHQHARPVSILTVNHSLFHDVIDFLQRAHVG